MDVIDINDNKLMFITGDSYILILIIIAFSGNKVQRDLLLSLWGT